MDEFLPFMIAIECMKSMKVKMVHFVYYDLLCCGAFELLALIRSGISSKHNFFVSCRPFLYREQASLNSCHLKLIVPEGKSVQIKRY